MYSYLVIERTNTSKPTHNSKYPTVPCPQLHNLPPPNNIQMTPSTNPRKRPALPSSVQPSIASFFSSAPSNGPSNSPATTTTPNSVTWRTTSTPNELPPSVKSGLLNVGMRVRKAVPEGLKTGTYKSTKFALTVSAQKGVLPQPKGDNNKREHQEDQQVEPPIGADRPARKIAVPKSLKRGYHAAVPRSVVGDADMVDWCGEGEGFEEAGFLRPVV